MTLKRERENDGRRGVLVLLSIKKDGRTEIPGDTVGETWWP